MGDLRDQLLKAGLVTDKQVKKAASAERRRKKAKGHKALARERAQREAEAEAKRRQRIERDRAAGKARAAQAATAEQRAQAEQIVRANKVPGATRGGRRWYYERPDGRVPYVTLSDEAAEGLERGRFALVGSGPGNDGRGVIVVTRDAAQRVQALDPERVLFLKPRG